MGSDWSKDNFDKNFPNFWGNIPRGLNYLPGFIPEVYRALKTNPNFRQLWADRIHKLFRNGGSLTKTNLTAIHDQCYTEMGEIPSWWSSYDYSLRNDFIQNREAKFFTKCQAQGLIDNSFGYPIFKVNGSEQHGGYISSSDTITITQSTASGTLYYTTDGNDPRLPIQPFVTENTAKKVKVPDQ
jgi:hypothetical protein